MIFISGVHGVGKSYFCDMVKKELGINAFTASQLIEKKKNRVFDSNKRIKDIDDNQRLLIESLEELRKKGSSFILDGHFCLLDAEGIIKRIPRETFEEIKPDYIVLLTEKPEIISKRREKRDGLKIDISDIKKFQDAEIDYAKEIANLLGVELIISSGTEDLDSIVDFLRRCK